MKIGSASVRATFLVVNPWGNHWEFTGWWTRRYSVGPTDPWIQRRVALKQVQPHEIARRLHLDMEGLNLPKRGPDGKLIP